MAAKRVTLADVAAASGIAVSTASLVLSGRGTDVRISQVVQERVKAKAIELGYRPNAMSVGLRKGVTSTLGFVSDSVASSRLAGDMIKGAIEAARDRGFMVFVGETSGNLTQEQLLLDAMFDRQVDGLILASMFTQARDLPPTIERTPAVLLNIGPTSPTCLPVVLPAEYEAGRNAAQALIDVGHRDIHLVGSGPGPEDVPPRALAGTQRLAGILAVLAENGLAPASGTIAHQWLPRDGWMIVSEILERGIPGALICFNDRLAMGAYQALQEHGLRIPHDVSVVSFDDASIASWMRPGLTTFALPHRSMGKRAADLLVTLIEHEREHGAMPADGGTHLIPMPMRDRASLGPPRA